MVSPLLAIVLGTLVSEDLTCISAGLLVSHGQLAMTPAWLSCAAGIYLGDIGLWVVGRLAGRRVLSWRRVSGILPPGGPNRFASWFNRHARAAIIGSRFAPGSRLPLYVAAGACRTSFTRFAGWSAAAVAVWTPLLVGMAALSGEQLATRVGEWLLIGRLSVVGAAAASVPVWRFAIRLISRRGRQRLAASISRIWRWEFWPMWLFYAPIAIWTFWLALRHGGYRSLTAANPGIADGGIVGESKFDILSKLPAEWTIPSAVIDPGAADVRVNALDVKMRSNGWGFPLILKPDVGQRGTGVRLVRTLDEAVAYLAVMHTRVVVQPFHPGPFEAGVFYYRLPGSPRGRILAVTDKHFPAVIGDGRSTIEDLVWAHPRYRMQARTFLTRLADRGHHVPLSGERIALGIAGNHAQGAMFTDGAALITPALEARIDAIAQQYDGFFIGRFDVRYRNREAFMGGCDLTIVELNGATAECTNVYDPAGSLLWAYRQLFHQWELVFAIGSANRRLGRRASSAERLLRILGTHLATSTPLPISD
jgi:membrane protein DedA with SNARE-associated domain